MTGCCPCCHEQIVLKDHLGKYSIPKATYTNAYIVMQKDGKDVGRLKIPCCKHCVDKLDPEEMWDMYKDDPGSQHYRDLRLVPNRIERIK